LSPGIAMGQARVMSPGELKVGELVISPSRLQAEIDSLDKAVDETLAELRTLRDAAGKKVAGPVAKIFDAQVLIAGDYEFLKQVKEEIVNQRRNAAHVYNKLVERTTIPLRQSSDQYMQQMALDIEAVAHRVLTYLSGGTEPTSIRFPVETILVSKSFSPGEVLNYRSLKAIGFLVAEGGRNSHMALIARSLMAPVVVIENIWSQVENECRVIVDGNSGVVIINPTDADWSDYQKRKKRQGPALIYRIKKLAPIPPVTADGRPVCIAANLELPGPVDDLLAEQRIPIGLYRTEFLYLQANRYPDEEEQHAHYAQIAEKFSRTNIILRTFDIGSDKIKVDSSTPHEDNPALGWRGIRSMLGMPEVFKTQIRAMLRASTRKNLQIMLPMISDIGEFEKARKLIGQVMLDLRRERIPFDEGIKIGVMVEVPSAALTADQLAARVDFISIGTNDLTQYTMSADRSNTRVADLYSPYHPSVLHLVKITVDAARRHHKPVSICGEVAGDLLALPLFIGMGVDQLSMTPSKIFDICRLVKKVDSKLVQLLVGPVISCSSAQAVMKRLESYRTELEK
jgi:phosphotransferase system enzyme I (PtsI)